MKNAERHSIAKRLYDESGQTLPWMAFLIVLFLGCAGLTLDLGHAYFSYRDLQASTDAATLAGAYAMTLSGATQASVLAAVKAYSSAPSGANANVNLGSVVVTSTLQCLPTSNFVGATCNASPTGDNVIQVTQTAVMPTIFINALSFFGVKAASSLNLGTTSTASMVGSNTQINAAIVLDTTSSMGQSDSDPNCLNTRIYCALQGIQAMLASLSPCSAGSTSTSCTAVFDQVGLFTFPNVTANTASSDTTCPTSNPTIPSYYAPTAPISGQTSWVPPTGTSPTYQITGYLDNYSSTNQQGGALNGSSALAIATGGGTGKNCSGMQTPGGDGTYYAGAINAAQASLMAAQALNPGSVNVMVILSDGDANSTKFLVAKTGNVYGSVNDQCQQGIVAANNATTLGTTVYTVAYGASTSGCSTDTSGSLANLSPCTAMQLMSSGWPGNTAHFYSDSGASQNAGQCPSVNSGSLQQIFSSIGATLSKARLVPNSVAGTS